MAKSARQAAPFLPPGLSAALRRGAKRLAGVAIVAVAAALAVALATYDPTDPSWNVASADAPRNALGAPGAVASDLALQTLGAGAGVVVLLLAGVGWLVAAGRSMRPLWLRGVLALAALGLAAAGFTTMAAPDSWPLHSGFGGIVGGLVFSGVDGALGLIGVGLDARTLGLALGVAAGIAFLLALGLSLRDLARAGRALGVGGRAMGGAAGKAVRGLASRTEPSFGRPATASAKPAGRVEPRPPASPARTEPKVEPPRTSRPKPSRRVEAERQPALDLGLKGDFQLPELSLLRQPTGSRSPSLDQAALQRNAQLLESVLDDFGVKGEVVRVRPGPVVTLYELEPAPGTKSSRVINLADDIARSMSAISARVAVIPGRNALGIELPNDRRETVFMREILASEAYESAKGKLPLILGKDIGGTAVVADLARMPHLLVAGTTGSGKSVAINVMILSLLYRLGPEACKFIMIDPKMLELSAYDGMPHLLAPVVTDPKKAVVALKWTVREMERRYQAMSKLGVRNLDGYNARIAEAEAKGERLTRQVQRGTDETGRPVYETEEMALEPMPYIVVVVDEMADLMMVAGKEVESAIQRLAQMARAAGIHLIMATQRPSVDVITGTIKANFPTRVSFQVTSRVDSRTIIDEQGAEQLLGNGDMLFKSGGQLTRVHGPFVSEDEVEAVSTFLRGQGDPIYVEEVTEGAGGDADMLGGAGGEEADELYDQAVAVVTSERKASTSFIQRRLQIGYNRAARMIERMEAEGVVSPPNPAGKREVLAPAPV